MTGNIAGNSLALRLGNGSGGFGGGLTLAFEAPYSVTVGDFNNDGNLDVASAALNLQHGLCLFWKRRWRVSLSEQLLRHFPRAIASRGFNGDGNDDYAATSPGFDTVFIRLGNGAGDFSNAPNLSINGQPHTIIIRKLQ